MPDDLPPVTRTIPEAFAATVARIPDRPCITYFDRELTFADLDAFSSTVAADLARRGVVHGDRVALYLQNDPEFAIAELAIWKVGGTVVSVNPMLREQELEYILQDSGAIGLVTLDQLWDDVASSVAAGTALRFVLTTDPDRWLADRPVPAAGGGRFRTDFHAVLAAAAPAPTAPGLGLDDVACIGYTSGTSGRPKGVVTTHENLAYNAEVYRRWMDISQDDVFLMATPIFHITGLVAGLALSFLTGMPMVLFHRFDPDECLRLATRWRTTFVVMAITAYQSLMNSPELADADLTALAKAYSGGAPVTTVVESAWRELTGHAIHNIYGLTETTSPSHIVPMGVTAPVDPESAAMSVGLPVPGAEVRVVDAVTLEDVPVGEKGEIWIRGPMVCRGYWNLPEATAASFVDGYLRTGDVGLMDADGWFYVIDRIKDMINAAGYKVWPREVEEFLLQHPSVDEAAVVGVPDPYRGETVKAFVTLKAGTTAEPDDIIAFAREHMAAYKYPRQVEVVSELPKTASGKILRRELRTRTASEASATGSPSAPGNGAG
ncbi:MAG TPA: AMP-binding protein [Acidimicrobiales bacterium]|nr:AMP-binding protein [Acidimicrobiales bacterium]